MNGTRKRQHKALKNNGETKNQEQPSREVTTAEKLNIIFEILTQPISIIGFQIICNEKQCSFTSLPDLSQYSSWPVYFNSEVFLYYLGFVTITFLLSSVSLGAQKYPVENFTYNLNGFITALLMIATLLVGEIIGIPISSYINDHVMHFVISDLIFKVSLGIFLYLFSFTAKKNELNPRETGTPFITAFYNGRQINPRLFNRIDIKTTYVKIFTQTIILFDIAMVLKSLNLTSYNGFEWNNLSWNNLSSHPTIVVMAILHCAYYLNHLYNEVLTMNYYFTRSEGMGYSTSMANSFRWSGLLAQTRYLKEHKIHYPNWELICLLSLYVFGQYVYTLTNNQKDFFRSHPDSPESRKMKTIPTSTGKAILCDGWWGRLRQPNISADILIHLTWLRFGFTAPPVLSIIGLFYYLINRAFNSQSDCQKKYGLAWKKYCSKVKYVLVPFVY